MASVFSKIVSGEFPAYIVAEDTNHIAFLDINPVAIGHVLVIPKNEVDYIFDLEDSAYSSLWDFARKVALGLKKAVPCKRIGVSVIGLEVPHTHIHLVPLQTMSDINFSKPKLTLSTDELERLTNRIKSELAA